MKGSILYCGAEKLTQFTMDEKLIGEIEEIANKRTMLFGTYLSWFISDFYIKYRNLVKKDEFGELVNKAKDNISVFDRLPFKQREKGIEVKVKGIRMQIEIFTYMYLFCKKYHLTMYDFMLIMFLTDKKNYYMDDKDKINKEIKEILGMDNKYVIHRNIERRSRTKLNEFQRDNWILGETDGKMIQEIKKELEDFEIATLKNVLV